VAAHSLRLRSVNAGASTLNFSLRVLLSTWIYIGRIQNSFQLFLDGHLGDFGLVFYADESKTRISETIESAGTVDWMAPWAHGKRIEDVRMNLDVFGLGKILYCLISGRAKLVYWWHRKPEHNLESLFPGDPAMPIINEVLDGCICEEEKGCKFIDAKGLMGKIDTLIIEIENEIGIPKDGRKVKCKFCGKGIYVQMMRDGPHPSGRTTQTFLHNWGIKPARDHKIKLFLCDNCGNAQIFDLDPYPGHENVSKAWE
jgi:hypothetical protein